MSRFCELLNRHWRWLALSLIAVAALLLGVDDALARAGGGGGYHGGGGGGGHGGGGGGHGGGGGDGIDIGWLIYLLFRYPVIGVPLLILVVLFFVYSAREGNSTYRSSVIRRGSAVMREGEKTAALEGVRAHDPNFDEVAFCRRVHLAFEKIQSAWCMQDLTHVRPFISDGVHERFLLQFQEQKAEGYRDHMEDLRVDWVDVVSVSSEGLFDEMAVRIRAAARDWRESLQDASRLSGSTQIEPFVEIWTFLRHRTATTDPGKTGLIEGNCPNCGAPIEMNQSAVCTHCKALLRSGAYDWVLAEITQESEWQVPRHDALPGAQELRNRDPEFDVASLEDRASVMFWRKATADRTGKIDPLRKIASPPFADAYAKQLKGDPTHGRAYPADCAVGAVQTLGIIPGADRDLALVSIRWSGKRFITDPAGQVRNTGEDLWAATLFVLARQADAKTDLGKSIASAHCPNCGAPESGGLSNACEFCGTVLNDGRHGWVLDNVTNQNSAEAGELLSRLHPTDVDPASVGWRGNPPDAPGLLAWMVKVATVDGNVDPREHDHLAQFAAKWSIPPQQVEAMIAAGLRGNLAVPDPRNPSEAKTWLAALAEEAWADGKLTREEMELLRSLGARAGLAEEDVNLLIRSARTRLYQQASSALRAQK